MKVTLKARIVNLASENCESSTGSFTCLTDETKSADAEYLADRYCWPCILKDALNTTVH